MIRQARSCSHDLKTLKRKGQPESKTAASMPDSSSLSDRIMFLFSQQSGTTVLRFHTAPEQPRAGKLLGGVWKLYKAQASKHSLSEVTLFMICMSTAAVMLFVLKLVLHKI